MNNSNYRLPIIVTIAGIFIIIVLSVVYVLTDGGKQNDRTGKNISGTPVPTGSDKNVDTGPELIADDAEIFHMKAIIKGIDLDNAMIVAQERGTSDEYEFTYGGATDIRTSYNKQITAALLRPGDFVSLTYTGEKHLKSVTGAKDVNIYKNVLQRTQDDNLRKITVGNTVYRYGDDLLVMNEGYFVGLDTVEDMDILSIYSVDDYIYMINIERGHGYFKMVNHSYFNGGTLKVGKYMSCEITDDLYLTLEEGDYHIVVEHDDFYGEADIMIDRDMTTILDMSAYTPLSALTGFFMFEISPASALLYVDGVLTAYDKAVELSQGEHWIQVAAGGYTPYTGFIEVGDSIGSLNIILLPAPSKTPDILYEDNTGDETGATPTPSDTSDGPDTGNDGEIADSTSDTGQLPENPTDEDSTGDPGSADTGSGTDDSGTDDNTGNNNSDTDNSSGTGDPGDGANANITIKASEGAAVFIDDVYKGTISEGSLTLPKSPGTHTVRLTKEGYITRRYTIYVEDDDEDAEYAFPEMVAE